MPLTTEHDVSVSVPGSGMDPSEQQQVEFLMRGSRYVSLLRPATVGGGIIRLRGGELRKAVDRFDQLSGPKVMKFVPASGAATRMFAKIHAWIHDPEVHKDEINAFFDRAEELPFFEQWFEMADKSDLETFRAGLEPQVKWLKVLVGPEGLNLENQPKGLISFHLLETPQTPVAEHLREAMAYACNDGMASVHFTVSPEHKRGFEDEVAKLLEDPAFSQVKWDIGFSFQDKSTDTIALDQNNRIVMVGKEKLRRPGGHGSLIQNLNRLDADMVFIKNIDNVAHPRLLNVCVEYKKALAGVLLELREDLAGLHRSLGKGLLDETRVQELRDKWNIRIPKGYRKLKAYLGRPIRVCGMVKNTGEPGGGPFWTKDAITGESLQIVEQAQVDPKDMRQQGILKSATHFNPVDIVCYLKDFEGKKIPLEKYLDQESYFIANKTYEGMRIKALEWPGLWNGAMAHWITLFVEVPVDTFNPVKEVLDLLRPTHRDE